MWYSADPATRNVLQTIARKVFTSPCLKLTPVRISSGLGTVSPITSNGVNKSYPQRAPGIVDQEVLQHEASTTDKAA